MKTKTLLFLASLVVLTTVARAAQYQTDDDVIVLPAYTVAAPRYTPVEKQINSSLDEVRQLANTPAAVATECPALKAIARESAALAFQALDAKAGRVAKL